MAVRPGGEGEMICFEMRTRIMGGANEERIPRHAGGSLTPNSLYLSTHNRFTLSGVRYFPLGKPPNSPAHCPLDEEGIGFPAPSAADTSLGGSGDW